MRDRFEDFKEYLNTVDVTSPRFTFENNQMVMNTSMITFNAISYIFLLGISTFILIKMDILNILFPFLFLIAIMVYIFWFTYEPANIFTISFELNKVMISHKNPLRKVLFFLNREETLLINDISCFFSRPTLQKASSRRYRIYIKLKEGNEKLIGDTSSATHAEKIALYLNKLIGSQL